MSSFDAVLFDCDGVLVDSESITNGVLREMLHELGWAVSQEDCFRLFVGRALSDETAVITAHTGFVVTDEWLLEFRRRRNDALAASLEAIPGAVAAVHEINDLMGGMIACASGADLGKVRLQLGKVGLDRVFAGKMFSGMDMPRSKPAPDVYLAAAAFLGVDPVRAAVIEDTVPGVTAGVAAGATVFGFCPPGSPAHHPPQVLLDAGATHIFTAMADLPALLAGDDQGDRAGRRGQADLLAAVDPLVEDDRRQHDGERRVEAGQDGADGQLPGAGGQEEQQVGAAAQESGGAAPARHRAELRKLPAATQAEDLR
jgi:beta-phosphoglucomutase-like phosphatase (HAD superfamily)